MDVAKGKKAPREWMEQKYIVEKLDCVQIAKIVSRDPKTTWSWLKHYKE